jgi:phytoene synthase
MERDDIALCRRITIAHARTFSLASAFLPPDKRRAAYAIYAFCRVADDLVDHADPLDRAGTALRLAGFRHSLDEALAGRPTEAIFRELAWAVRHFAIPAGALHALLSGVARDLEPIRYATWGELVAYCEGVASSVGEMCAHVFGLPAEPARRERALRYARTLGVAMQLTNVLRDVGEDARRGRCYIPDEDLALFGIGREEVLHDPQLGADERWRPLMAFLIGRARSLYEAARPGIAMLDPDARRCAGACATGYAEILGAIERLDFDTITTRARLPLPARLRVAWSAWRAPIAIGEPSPGRHPVVAYTQLGSFRDTTLAETA